MICVTGGEADPAALARRLAAHAHLPLQEVRLDLLRRVDDDALALLCSPQVVATCRTRAEGGGFAGSDDEHARLLEQALERQPGHLDLEGSAGPDLWRRLHQRRGRTRLIASWHLFEPTGVDRLRQLIDGAPAEADLLKLAVTVDDAADLLPLLSLPHHCARPLILIGMGQAGLASRVLYRRFGSPWTYVVPDGAAPVAAGQLSVSRAVDWRIEQQLSPLGLLGGPGVMRSPGPRVYNALFRQRGLPFIYLPVISTRPGPALALLQALGFAGCSVTMPLKEGIAEQVRSPDGAVNTALCRDGVWSGANTDIDALQSLLAPHAGRTALLLGAGGAARAAAIVLKRLGCPTVVVARSIDRAGALAADNGLQALPWAERGRPSFELLVNATPVGAEGVDDPMPFDLDWRGKVVLDAVIATTALVRRARQGGALTIVGTEWWLQQGSRQMELLTGEPVCVDDLRALYADAPSQIIEDATAPITLEVPGSKSLTQRALVLAALAPGESCIERPLDCDDSRTLRQALRALGVQIAEEYRSWRVRPRITEDGRPELLGRDEALWCGDAGSTLRFLAPLSLVAHGTLALDGCARLRERPLDDLLAALGRLGVAMVCLEQRGRLPLQLHRRGDPPDGTWVDVGRSSQFLSGLLMVAPALPRGLRLEARSPDGIAPVSWPYVTLTLQAMAHFGVAVTPDDLRFDVAPASYRPCTFAVEGDWSAAAFLLAAGRLAGREVRLLNLPGDSVQGDRAIVSFLDELGRPRDHRFDLNRCPDLIAPLAVAAVTASHPVRIEGVAHARLKESDRIAVLARGLREAGATVQEHPDGLTIQPGGTLRPARLDPAGDHRMAMAFGLLSLLEPGVEVLDRDCVSKSFPGFWAQLERLR